MRSRLFVATAIALGALGVATALAIIGGEEAERSEWPWVAQVRVDGRFTCGGALVDSRWVLTAGHCLGDDRRPYSASRLKAAVGRFERETGGEVLAVDEVIRHPAWEDEIPNHDVALLHLARPAGAGPAELGDPAARQRWRRGSVLQLAGWGATEELVSFWEGSASEERSPGGRGQSSPSASALPARGCGAQSGARARPRTKSSPARPRSARMAAEARHVRETVADRSSSARK